MILVGAAIVGLGGGCGKAVDSRFVPVSGRVTLDGQPLPGATVCFRSERDGLPARTDADGNYQLRPGAPPGSYRVDIGKLVGSPQAMATVDPGAIGHVGDARTPVARPKQLVPARYSDPRQTDLRFTVTSSGTNRADFELVSR